MAETTYPEHEKLHAVRKRSQAIGEFLAEGDHGYQLCEFSEELGEFLPVTRSTEQILADYFGIDLGRLEAEKRAMLDAQRALNARAGR
jgi:hypothetical protein